MNPLAVSILAVAVAASTTAVDLNNVTDLEDITAYGYLRKFGIPLAKKMRKAEEEADQTPNRIVGGEYTYIEYFPYQAGLIVTTAYGEAICGGSLLNSRRVLTAAHCWFDGQSQAYSLKVILGSTRLFGHDGIRMDTNHVLPHPSFYPPVTNDIAMIILPNYVEYSSKISPVALPSGDELRNSFVGWYVLASGYGYTSDYDSVDVERFLSYVYMPVVSFEGCYPFQDIDISKSICASGGGGKSVCQGDSGGPIVVNSNYRLVLIGVSSFGSISGCQKGFAAVFTRVAAYMSWINSLL